MGELWCGSVVVREICGVRVSLYAKCLSISLIHATLYVTTHFMRRHNADFSKFIQKGFNKMFKNKYFEFLFIFFYLVHS